MNNPETVSHANVGTFESKERTPGATPECAISEDAQRRLEAWGVDHEAIAQLRELAGAYEYNNVPAQIEEIAKHGVYVDRNSDNGPTVILPDFFELEGTKRAGQCVGIAYKTLRDMVQEGWLDKVNQANALAGRASLERYLIIGQPSNHFSTHYWNELRPQGGDITDSIIVDGSTQQIVLGSESGYKSNYTWGENDFLSIPKHEMLKIGRITQDQSGSWEITGANLTLVGMSEDYALGVDIGFVANQEGGIQPAILAYDDSNVNSATCTRINGHFSWQDAEGILTDAHRVELERALTGLENITLQYDDSAHQRYIDDELDRPQEIDLSDFSRVPITY